MMAIIFSEANFQTPGIKRALSHLKMHFSLNAYKYESIKYQVVIAEIQLY